MARSRGEAMMQALYRQLVTLMVLTSNLDAQVDQTVERETAQALLSVFPRTELRPFLALETEDKREKLLELSDVVLGIRLFNRVTGKGGRDIPDIPVVAWQACQELSQVLSREADEFTRITEDYTKVIDHLRQSQSGVGARISALKEELTNRRQYLQFIQHLQEAVSDIRDNVSYLKKTLSDEMTALKTLVGTKASVLKEQVYPKFMIVARLWKDLTAQNKELERQRELLSEINVYRDSIQPSYSADELRDARDFADQRAAAEAENRLDEFDAQHAPPPPSTGALDNLPAGTASEQMAAPVRIYYQATPDFLKLPIEYKGFCPWTIVHRDGLLLHGDSSLGLVRFGGKNYAFASEDNLNAFMSSPSKYIQGIAKMGSEHPQIVMLLGLNRDFNDDTSGARSKDYGPRVLQGVHRQLRLHPTRSEMSCQTELHPVESHIDPRYHWNEWEMRRKALKLINLRDKATHSQQTELSHFRRENETQHYAPKAQSSQTVENSSTNVARKVNYMTGLRGNRDKRFGVVNLEIDIS
eukprot:TRINITY_DN7969_c0_g1_i1.p1 TRINITY_DN7969_c0_g1~~TRINITY_DN7969_c0_g1_i1.p1  ORF type:complete len:617 (+),score=134.09 TRINITY_DN7969_c0_g1_i1:269-1852(+)